MRQEPALPRNTEPSPPADAAAPEDLGGQRALVCATRELLRRGHSVVLCLVVLTRGSTYRKAGADGFGVGSPLFRPERLAANDWDWLRQQCRAFVEAFASAAITSPR